MSSQTNATSAFTDTPACLHHIGLQRLAYWNERQRPALMRAAAHIPESWATCTDLRDLEQPIPELDAQLMKWISVWRNHDCMGRVKEPNLDPATTGHYVIVYDRQAKSYKFHIMWNEYSLDDESDIASTAIGFTSQRQLLDLISQAKAEASLEWERQSEMMSRARAAKALAARSFIDAAFDEMP